MLTIFKHLTTINLLHAGDCKLLGVSSDDGLVFVEELYGDDDWLAQHCITINDGIVKTIDESYGDNLDIVPLTLPENLIEPVRRPCCEMLQFSGARLRGILEEERVDDVVRPLKLADKIELVEFMEWDIEPMALIGVGESVVLSHTTLPDGSLIVCRRLRVLYRLHETVVNERSRYDYDALDVHILHEFSPHEPEVPELVDCLNDIDDVVLLRPMDCLYTSGHFYVADGGEDDDVSAVHVFESST